MFETVVSKLVKTVGADLYIPSASIATSENLAPLVLVERKASKWWLGNNKYYVTQFTLDDVVESGTPLKVDVAPEKDLVAFNKTSTVKVDGRLSGHFKALFSAELDNVDTITVKADLGDLHFTEVSEQSLLDNLKGRKLSMQHELIKEISAKKRRALCVVVGVLKTTAPVTITATLNMKFKTDEKASCFGGTAGGGEAEADVEQDKNRTLNLPAGTALAYQVVELDVSDNGEIAVKVSEGAKGGFHAAVDVVDAVAISIASDPRLEMRDEEEMSKHFKGFLALAPETRKELTQRILKLCGGTSKDLEELSAQLYTADGSSPTEEVQTALDLISEHRRDTTVTQSIQALCRILRNLDTEALTTLSAVPVSDLQLLLSVLKTTHRGNHLPHSEQSLQQLMSSAPQVLSFILIGLGYTLCADGLKAPVTCSQQFLYSAYTAVFGLNYCYSD